MELVKKNNVYHCVGPVLGEVEPASMVDIEPGPIALDLSAVTAITSAGLKSFINWLDRHHLVAHYHNCSVPFVMQLSMVRELLKPGTRVESFLVPVSCINCGKTANLTYFAGRDFTPGDGLANPSSPPQSMEGCELEFDCTEETYFFFVKCLEK